MSRDRSVMVRFSEAEIEELAAYSAPLGYSYAQLLRESVLARVRGLEGVAGKKVPESVKRLAEIMGAWRALGADRPKTSDGY